MGLMDKVAEDLKSAMINKEEVRLETLRSLKAAVKNFEIDKKKEAEDSDVLDIVQKEVKKRRDSIEQYKQGGRQDLVDHEQAQIDVLAVYMPEQMSEDELREIIKSVITETGASSKADTGKVMGQLMPKIKGKADGGMASKIVSELLS